MDAAQLVAILIVAVVVLLVVAAKWWERRRAASIVEWARQNGWHYEQRRPDLAAQFTGYPFGRGRVRHARHVLTRTCRGHDVLAFEYAYTTPTWRNNQNTTFHEVIAVPVPAPRPMLEVSREHFGHKLLGMVGVHDLQLPNEQFNAAFRIHTEDDRFAHDVLSEDVMEWLLADERAHDVTIRFDANYLVTRRRGKIDPSGIPADVDFVIDFLERVPAPAWNTTT